MSRKPLVCCAAAVAVMVISPWIAAAESAPVPNKAFTVVKQILADRCSGCHAWAKTPETLADEGMIVAGDPDNSPIYRMVSTDAMPMRGEKLSADQKEIIRVWIAAGAPVADAGEAAPSITAVTPDSGPEKPRQLPTPDLGIPLHEISGFTSSTLLLAAGIVGAVHILTMLEAGHAFAESYPGGEPPDSVMAAKIQALESDPAQQALRWWHVGLLVTGELFYAYNAATGISMISDSQPGVITKADIHRYAFYTHAALMAAQVALGFVTSYALSSGSHGLVEAAGAGHVAIGFAIPAVMITAGVLNMLP
jgi:hypothetical protein